MISKNGKPVRSIVLGSFLVLAGAAAWILLNAGQAGALVNADQESTNVNVGVAVANTGGNVGVGNASTNNANSNQRANAGSGGGGDKVAVNTADVSNHSDGSATIVTGDANATGNTASNHTTQAVDADSHGSRGGVVNVDQESTNVNVGIAVANTGGNIGVGNASTNRANANQNANAGGSGADDKVASNLADVSNHSNGSTTILTGNAWATGNTASNHTVQTVDAGGAGGIVLADQNSDNLNFGLGIANSGLNIGVGNASVNQANANQNAVVSGSGGDDVVAVNDLVGSNASDGDVLIHTGSAHAVGNVANNSTTQVLDGHHVVAVGDSSALPMTLLFLLMGILFLGRPARHVAVRRRT